jgi:hypothetical protein
MLQLDKICYRKYYPISHALYLKSGEKIKATAKNSASVVIRNKKAS